MRPKNLFTLLIISAFIGILTSCEKDTPIGIWDDNIKLSTKNASFHAAADCVIISTEGTWWWVTDISVGDSIFSDFRDVNLESDHYLIEREGVVVERRNSTTLFIKADANTSGAERTIKIGLEAGDYFDGIVITQAAD